MTNPELEKQISVVGAHYYTVAGSELNDSDRIVWQHPILKVDGLKNPYRLPANLMDPASEVIQKEPFPEPFIEFPFEEPVPIAHGANWPKICIVGGNFLGGEGAKREKIIEEIGAVAVAEVEPIAIKYDEYPQLPLEKDEETERTSKVFVIDIGDCYKLQRTVREGLMDDFLFDLASDKSFDPRENHDSFSELVHAGVLGWEEYLGYSYFLAKRRGDQKSVKQIASSHSGLKAMQGSENLEARLNSFKEEFFN